MKKGLLAILFVLIVFGFVTWIMRGSVRDWVYTRSQPTLPVPRSYVANVLMPTEQKKNRDKITCAIGKSRDIYLE